MRFMYPSACFSPMHNVHWRVCYETLSFICFHFTNELLSHCVNSQFNTVLRFQMEGFRNSYKIYDFFYTFNPENRDIIAIHIIHMIFSSCLDLFSPTHPTGNQCLRLFSRSFVDNPLLFPVHVFVKLT